MSHHANAAATNTPSLTEIAQDVAAALTEDIGSGDVSAQLIPADQHGLARIISREEAVICGCPWFVEAFRQVDPAVQVQWHLAEGEKVSPDTEICRLEGSARSLLTAERNGMNFVQMLSGTATVTRRYVDAIAGTGCRLLDTRKTIPGLRLAQKYAVACGGGVNHRVGLYDAYIIKENHIAAAGSITAAVKSAFEQHPELLIEVEVETLTQLTEAIDAGAGRVMLDNFDLAGLREGVALNDGRVELEASGGVTLETIRGIAETGVDYISVGALTKHVRATDLSMRFIDR